jgi:hypothetical protein
MPSIMPRRGPTGQPWAPGYLALNVPFDGFNIDRVLVGPPGVFSVETKTRREPVSDSLSPACSRMLRTTG